MPKAKRYDKVTLLETIDDFPKGAWGAIVEEYTTPYEAYDIEIMTDDGKTIGVADAVLPELFEVEKGDAESIEAVRFQSIQTQPDGSRAVILFNNGAQFTVNADELYQRLNAG
jgi:hypothetical protein